MNEDLVARLMQAEKDATAILADAKHQAEKTIEDATAAAAASQAEIEDAAQAEANRILQAGQEAAAAARQEIMEQAQAEADRMATSAARHQAAAVALVVDRVTGRR